MTCSPAMSTLRRPQSWIRAAIWVPVIAIVDVNDTETLSPRRGNIASSSSAPMLGKLSTSTRARPLVVRCECGSVLDADCKEDLIVKVRTHIGEFHPDLGANIPADLILAMAEEKE